MNLAPWNIFIKSLIFSIFIVTLIFQTSDSFGMLGDDEEKIEETKTRLQNLKAKINKELQSINYDEYYIFAACELKTKWVEDLKTCKVKYLEDESTEIKPILLNCEIIKSEYWGSLIEKLQERPKE